MSTKNVLISAALLAGSLTTYAQTSTNSPYTRYGLGQLSDQAFVNNAAMGGMGYGLRTNCHINTLNPASYSAVDSLTFMFDTGLTLTRSDFEENGYKTNAKNSTFDYMVMQFRLIPRLGFAMGLLPYSNVGYNFSRTASVPGNEEVTATNMFYGEGGLHQVFAGLGFRVLPNLSVGANVGYLYGNLDYSTGLSLSTTSDRSIVYNNISVKSYKADFGAQYTYELNKNHRFTLGAVYGLGHQLNSKETKGIQIIENASQPSYSAKDEELIEDAYGIPTTFGVGVVYQQKNNLTAGIDYELQKWSDVEYSGEKGKYNDRHRVAAGMEFLPNPLGRAYWKRIRYRAGVHYTSSYLKLPTGDGPKEYGISAGFGLPLHLYQRNTVLSVTGQYTRVKPSAGHLLSENRFELKIGLTFIEHWFMKWKVN